MGGTDLVIFGSKKKPQRIALSWQLGLLSFIVFLPQKYRKMECNTEAQISPKKTSDWVRHFPSLVFPLFLHSSTLTMSDQNPDHVRVCVISGWPSVAVNSNEKPIE